MDSPLGVIIDVFEFIFSLLGDIIAGVWGVITLLGNIVGLVINITKILPSPLYGIFVIFMELYLTIFIYKIMRKG